MFYTHRPCKFCLNLVSGLSSHVLTVLVRTGVVLHTPSRQVLFELGSGLSSYVLTVLVWTGVVLYAPSLQVLFELGFMTEQQCAD